MATLLTVDAMNLFAGDHDPANSKHLILEEVRLPALEENYVEHAASGARVQIEIPTHINKLEPKFKIVGWDPNLLVQFGLSTKTSTLFTMYGVIVDRGTGKNAELKAVCEGRLGKLEPDPYKRGEVLIQECAISGVTHYEIHFDDKEMIYWDFFTNAWRVNGVDQNATMNRILRIPNSLGV